MSVEHDQDRVVSWGVHGWRGEWLINGSSEGLVRVRFDPRARGHATGFPVKVHTLRISVTDPVGLIATLTGDPPVRPAVPAEDLSAFITPEASITDRSRVRHPSRRPS